MGKIDKFGLRERIAIIAIGVMLVAIASIALASSYIFSKEYGAALESRSVAIATSLKLQLERLLQLDLRLENLTGFEEQCQEVVKAYGGIEYAMVVGRDGTILFHNDPGKRGQPADHKLTILRQTAPQSVIEDSRDGGKSHITIVPVVSPAGEHQASVVVGFPAAQVTGKARQMAFVTLGLGFIFLLVAIFGLVTMLSALVTNPLGRLIDTLGGIRDASDLSRRVRVGTTGDIARLAGAFNRMMEELQSTVEELQQRTSELQRANQAKDEFLSVVSHELRTPLNVVVGYSAMLREGLLGDVNPRQREALAKVLGRAKDQLGMINSILEAAQIGAGAVTVLRKNVNLSEILDEMRVGYDIPRNKEITLHWEYPPELLVAVDGEKLKHILQNIIDNAIKFTEKGSITISVRHVEEPGVVQFKIADTGIGIPTALLPTIFEKFRQADSSDNRSFEGVGLGLYIVKCLIDLMGGRVEVESEEGKGSTFTLAIPVEVRRKGMQHGAEEPAR